MAIVRILFSLSVILGLSTVYFTSPYCDPNSGARFWSSLFECAITLVTIALVLWRCRSRSFARPTINSNSTWIIVFTSASLCSALEVLLLLNPRIRGIGLGYADWSLATDWGRTFASCYARICIVLLLNLERERYDAIGSKSRRRTFTGDEGKAIRNSLQILFAITIVLGLITAYCIGPYHSNLNYFDTSHLDLATSSTLLDCAVLVVICCLLLLKWRNYLYAKPTFEQPELWICAAALGIFSSLSEFLALSPAARWLSAFVIVTGITRFGTVCLLGIDRRRFTKFLVSIAKVEAQKQALPVNNDVSPEAKQVGIDQSDTDIESRGRNDEADVFPSPSTIRAEIAPGVPEELLSAFSTRSCILFAGGGVSAQAGVPLWSDGWSQVLEEAIKREPTQNWDNLRYALQKGEIVALVDLLRGRLSHEILVHICQNVFSCELPRQPNLYRVLRDIPFSGVLTSVWDNSLEDALQRRRPTALIANDSDSFGQVLREKQFFFLKLNGDLSHPETVLFTVEDYRRAVYEREQFSQFLGSLVSSNTLLFIGTSLTTIDDFFSCMRVSKGGRRHFALVPKQPNLDFESERFLSRYGVELLGYDATATHPEVEAFICNLFDQILKRPELLESIRFESGTLDRVLLRNIGPFQELDLDIRSSWNVLLGNNGCGKSSILKAIALGLCGDEPSARQIAPKLLNAKADKGSVELWFGNQKFVTTILREGRKVVVKSEQLTPFRTGRWLVLGFPALRGVSQLSPSGPDDKAGLPNPDINDLLPLIDGAIDARLDSIKQWIINTYLRSELADKDKPQQTNKGKQLLTAFFGILGELTPEVECRFKSVDSLTWEVVVTTDDGDVPIDYISQGTSSVFGWVGILLQRLYEVFPNTPDPEKQHALVLADEIDAHMHPAWQQSLLSSLQRIFPTVQFIATTHSPLIVGGLPSDSIFRFARDDDGRVIRLEISPDMTMGRADQILTTPLFGLTTTLDTETQATAERYQNLLGKRQRTVSEEEEFQNLRGTLQFRIPPPHVDLEERRAAVRERDSLVREAHEKLDEAELSEGLH
jgi:predicted ATP-binding protein involved in virulence